MNYGSMSVTGSAMEGNLKSSSDLLRELEIMEKDIAGLGDSINHLRDRIDPICRPSAPQSATSPSAPTPICSGLTNRVMGFRASLARIQAMVSDTHSRLDL